MEPCNSDEWHSLTYGLRNDFNNPAQWGILADWLEENGAGLGRVQFVREWINRGYDTIPKLSSQILREQFANWIEPALHRSTAAPDLEAAPIQCLNDESPQSIRRTFRHTYYQEGRNIRLKITDQYNWSHYCRIEFYRGFIRELATDSLSAMLFFAPLLYTLESGFRLSPQFVWRDLFTYTIGNATRHNGNDVYGEYWSISALGQTREKHIPPTLRKNLGLRDIPPEAQANRTLKRGSDGLWYSNSTSVVSSDYAGLIVQAVPMCWHLFQIGRLGSPFEIHFIRDETYKEKFETARGRLIRKQADPMIYPQNEVRERAEKKVAQAIEDYTRTQAIEWRKKPYERKEEPASPDYQISKKQPAQVEPALEMAWRETLFGEADN